MKNTFKELYNSIIAESNNNLNITKEAAKKKIIDQQKENINPITPKEVEEKEPKKDSKTSAITSMEKDFVSKFVRYNELQILKNELPKITADLKAINGFDSQAIDQEIQTTLNNRQSELDDLTKELTELRDSINKEAEEINYKKSIIDLFDAEANKEIDKIDPETNMYGYKSPETNIETLPNNETPAKIDDLQQAEQLSADALEPVNNSEISKNNEKVLIDSKKKK